MRIERIIHDAHMGLDDFTVFCSRFNDLIVALECAGSQISKERIVHLFLNAMKDSPR
jgi:hypothetical protein